MGNLTKDALDSQEAGSGKPNLIDLEVWKGKTLLSKLGFLFDFLPGGKRASELNLKKVFTA